MPNKTLQLTPSRIALSSADKPVFLFPQPALLAQRLIGAAELGVGLFYMQNPRLSGISEKLAQELELLDQHFDTKGDCSEAAGRLYIRVAYSVLEAQVCIIRDQALQCIKSQTNDIENFDFVQASFLEDYAYKIDENGRLKRQDYSDRKPFTSHFAFALVTLAKFAKVDVGYLKQDGWMHFKNTIRIRNRITHPKTVKDLSVSKEDMITVHKGLEWAMSSLLDILDKSPVYGPA